jgi:hypothetical protein
MLHRRSFILACPIFSTIDKGKGIVKGKILLSVEMSNAE